MAPLTAGDLSDRSALRAFVARRAFLLAGLCALASASAPLSRFWPAPFLPGLQWGLELAAHWQWLYLWGGAVSLIGLLWARQRSVWLLVPTVACASSFLWPSAALDKASAGTRDVLVVATANLNLHTTDFTPLVKWLRSSEAPDVLFLQEFTAQAQSALQDPDLQHRYAHRMEVPQPDPFGLAILSRHPLAQAQALPESHPLDTLRLRALLEWQGRTVSLSAVHPMPPLSAAYAQRRDQVLREEAEHLAQTDGLGLLVGDFNTTPWARGLFALQPTLRRASGATGTWPQMGGWLSVLPLDHVLATAGWQLEGRPSGPDLGSDHRPVVVRLVAKVGS